MTIDQRVIMGQANAAGAEDALFRDIFTGEVFTAFNKSTKFLSRIRTQNISGGIAATFYATGDLKAKLHTPGTMLGGQNFKQNKVVVNVDELLHATNYIDNYDELKHPAADQIRSELSTQQGVALANVYDLKAALTGLKAARSGANVAGGPSGATITKANARTDADALVAAIFDARTSFSNDNIPWQSDTFTYVRPAQYALLAQSTKLLNKDWGGEGSYARGEFQMVAGIPVVETNTLPVSSFADDTAILAAGEDPEVLIAKYRGDYSKTVALTMHRAAIGSVILKGVNTKVAELPEYNAHMLSSQMGIGLGVLRPECAREIALP